MVNKVELLDSLDVIQARQCARNMARELGFGLTDQTRIATAVSEVAHLALYNCGTFSFSVVVSGSRRGLECACAYEWPEPSEGYAFFSSGQKMPEALGGVRQLVDDFELLPQPDNRVTVVMRKWL